MCACVCFLNWNELESGLLVSVLSPVGDLHLGHFAPGGDGNFKGPLCGSEVTKGKSQAVKHLAAAWCTVTLYCCC